MQEINYLNAQVSSARIYSPILLFSAGFMVNVPDIVLFLISYALFTEAHVLIGVAYSLDLSWVGGLCTIALVALSSRIL